MIVILLNLDFPNFLMPAKKVTASGSIASFEPFITKLTLFVRQLGTGLLGFSVSTDFCNNGEMAAVACLILNYVE